MLVGEMMRGMMRGLLANERSGEMKAIELKPGQVVKATVLQTFPNQEAMLNIEGAKVRAKLEIPLKAGQTAMMQVQNESTNMQILLKPLSITGEVADEAVQDLLRNLQVKDTAANRVMAQQLLSSPVPLNKESIQQIRQVMAANPPNIPAEEWNQAIVIAHNKGTPMTEESVRALHQVLFGKPLHETVQQLTRQLNDLISQSRLSPQAQQKIEQLTQLLQQMRELSAKLTGETPSAQTNLPAGTAKGNGAVVSPLLNLQGQASGSATQAGNVGGGNGLAAQDTGQVPVQGQSQLTGASQGNRQDSGVTNQTQTGSTAGGANQTSGVTQPSASAPVGNQSQAGNPAVANPANTASDSPAGTPRPGSPSQPPLNPGSLQSSLHQYSRSVDLMQPNMNPGSTPNQSASVVQANSAANTATAPSATNQQSVPLPGYPQATNPNAASAQTNAPIVNTWAPPTAANYASAGTYSVQVKQGEPQIVQQLLQHMGLQTEHSLGQSARQTDAAMVSQKVQQAQQTLNTLTNQLTQQATQVAAAQADANPLDSVKGALMQLLSMSEVPASVRGTLESLVQNITGQQLLLSPDKYGSFSYVTMTIPLFDQHQDGQTAEVHIQSRKGKKGQLDPKNCRLLFDLNMKELGKTMVDVHVVDRIVNVYVLNDHPAVQALVESSREEIADSMESIGYQFLSLKVSDYPQHLSELQGGEPSEAQAVKLPTQNGQNYRGVDYRV